MNSLFLLLIVLGIGAAFYAIRVLRRKSALHAGSKLTKVQYRARESERDRLACLAASKSLDGHPAPREDYAKPVPAGSADPSSESDPGRSLPSTAESRRRRAASSYFDEDMVGTHREVPKAPPA